MNTVSANEKSSKDMTKYIALVLSCFSLAFSIYSKCDADRRDRASDQRQIYDEFFAQSYYYTSIVAMNEAELARFQGMAEKANRLGPPRLAEAADEFAKATAESVRLDMLLRRGEKSKRLADSNPTEKEKIANENWGLTRKKLISAYDAEFRAR
jgi:hypothetical protein